MRNASSLIWLFLIAAVVAYGLKVGKGVNLP